LFDSGRAGAQQVVSCPSDIFPPTPHNWPAGRNRRLFSHITPSRGWCGRNLSKTRVKSPC